MTKIELKTNGKAIHIIQSSRSFGFFGEKRTEKLEGEKAENVWKPIIRIAENRKKSNTKFREIMKMEKQRNGKQIDKT